jgi:hypothetical protein
MSRPGRLLAALGIVIAPVVLAGCASIPTDASTKQFCTEGEKFSASTTLEQGKKAADRLAEVGTPQGIPASARKGFVELVDRVRGAKDAADFHRKAKKLTKAEARHLADLSAYIKETCDLG